MLTRSNFFTKLMQTVASLPLVGAALSLANNPSTVMMEGHLGSVESEGIELKPMLAEPILADYGGGFASAISIGERPLDSFEATNFVSGRFDGPVTVTVLRIIAKSNYATHVLAYDVAGSVREIFTLANYL